MTSMRVNFDGHKLLFSAVICLFISSSYGHAKELSDGIDPKVKAEIEYAEALNNWGLPDYAKMVLDKIKDPAAGPMIKTIRIQALGAKGDWAAIKAIIAKESNQDSLDAWAMKLAMADNYYAWSMYPEAQGIYESLLKKYPDGPPEALNSFYTASAYRYAQMLLLMGNQKNAIRVYEDLAKAKLPKHERRQIITETAELMVKQAEVSSSAEQKVLFEKIDKITTEILWVQDIWFGKAIVILAHVKKIQGDVDGAMRLIEDYKPNLLALDEDLKKIEKETGANMAKLSPMAQCRYLLGVMMQERADALLAEDGDHKAEVIDLLVGPKKSGSKKRGNGAYKHFMNVFVKYPSTAWAPEAGVRAKQVREILVNEPFNANIKETITAEVLEKVEQAQFKNAQMLFKQNQYKEAAEAYIKVLNLFPESKAAVTALGNLARCYIEMEEEFLVMTTASYLAERFSADKEYYSLAGDQILRVGMKYSERNQNDLSEEVYESFFENFPKHPSAISMLYRSADTKFKNEDYDGALVYYTRIKENYKGVPLWYAALSRITSCYSELGESTKEIKALQEYIAGLEGRPRPGQELISARYREALAYKKLGPKHITGAFNRFSKIITLLSNSAGRAKYEENPEQKEKNNNILQGALYNKAACYMKMPPPKGKDENYRKKQAITTLEKLVTDFPKSAFSASALSQVGTLWTVLDDPKKAGEALKRLQKEYPDSAEAKNASFMLGMNLLKMGRKQQAIIVFREMFASSDKYTDYQIFTAGTELHKVGVLDIALSAYDKVLANTKERAIREPALFAKGECLIAQEEYAEGVKSLELLMKDYPRSSYTTKATLLLSEAYSQLAKDESDNNKRITIFNKAVEALNRSRSFEKTPAGNARLDIELARIYQRKSDAEKRHGDKEKVSSYMNDSIAAYQKLILFGNPDAVGVKTYIETAYAECIPLLLGIERWSDVMEDCDSYISEFPNGKNIRDVRSWRSKAKVKLAAKGEFSDNTSAVSPEDKAGDEGDQK